MFTHVVLFWLKDPADSAARDAIVRDCEAILRKIPTVRHLFAGRPAMTPREVVDNSYHVGLCVVFDDRAGHDLYQGHELHLQFVARNKNAWTRVQVFDFA